MKKVILVLCVVFIFAALSANAKMDFILHHDEFINNEFTNEEFG